jgi:hypothetical protein
MKSEVAVRNPVGVPVAINLATTIITTAAFTQVMPATPKSASAFEILNSSAQPLILAFGAAGVEVPTPYIIPPDTASSLISMEIPVGTRVSAKAVGASTAGGWLTMSLFA